MMPYTYYNFWFLPKYQQEYADKYLLFDDITEKELKVFEEVFIKLIKIYPFCHTEYFSSVHGKDAGVAGYAEDFWHVLWGK